MNPVWIVGNGVVVLGSVFCMVRLSQILRPWSRTAPPWIGATLFGVTALITGLQFVVLGLQEALQRDAAKFEAGEVWRMVTPLFVQPGGVWQALPNAFFLIAFLPLSERVYRWGVLAIYFTAGIAGQLINYAWELGQGGSSTAAFGLMGGLLVYVLRQRRGLPAAYPVVAAIGLATGLVLVLAYDAHGVGLLAGAVMAWALPVRELPGAVKAAQL
jgi:rhomboid protease GluP